jgi:hypothetical protein
VNPQFESDAVTVFDRLSNYDYTKIRDQQKNANLEQLIEACFTASVTALRRIEVNSGRYAVQTLKIYDEITQAKRNTEIKITQLARN